MSNQRGRVIELCQVTCATCEASATEQKRLIQALAAFREAGWACVNGEWKCPACTFCAGHGADYACARCMPGLVG